MLRAVEWAERYQIVLYLASILLGAVIGLAVPALSHLAEAAINPALILLLFATFLGVPMINIVRGLRDVRFLAVVIGVNFVVVPVVVFGLSRFVEDDKALVVGLLLVLLTPCVDYVIVFTGLVGGARDRLLAATPLLMLIQILLLPLFLPWFAGASVVAGIAIGPFVEAFLLLIVIPLATAAAVQLLSTAGGRSSATDTGQRDDSRPGSVRSRIGHGIEAMMANVMVPLMMVTLAVVVASQISAVGTEVGTLLRVVPLYIAFAVVMTAVGLLVGRLARLDPSAVKAVAFSGVTRNSLVVLPLALALPTGFALAPLAVVTQTLVELLTMVALVWILPRLTQSSSPKAQLRS
jgi:ACR3 family arsenite transporter